MLTRYLSSPPAWLVLAVGCVIWLAGNLFLLKVNRAREKGRDHRPVLNAIGNTLAAIGFLTGLVSLYAGFWGPLTIRKVKIDPFPLSIGSAASRRMALNYVLNNTTVSSRAAQGWHGASDEAIEYTMVNKGDRNISSLVLRFKQRSDRGGGKITLKLTGPFPAGKKSRRVVEVPLSVDRSYFNNNSPVERGHIVGARF